jgi:hypothetical protein
VITAFPDLRLPAGRGAAPFTLSKWYLDCVAPDGRVVIGYWASLGWRDFTLTWQQVTLYEPGQPARRQSSLSSSPPPGADGDTISWHAEALDCCIVARTRQQAIRQRLLDDSTGIVEWRADAPAADVSVTLVGRAPVHGAGYAERLLITVPPWRLPIRELRWGRWIDDTANRSVVWIDWRDASPRTWVFVNGQLAASAVVTDERVSAGAVDLRFGERRTLDAWAFSQIVAAIPPLRAVVPKSLLALRQTRWCSDATLTDGDARALNGRAVHELVVFR